MLDFCADIVASVPDPITDEDAGEAKKKKRAPRKKKDSSKKDDDFEDEGEEPEDVKPIKGGSDDDYDEE